MVDLGPLGPWSGPPDMAVPALERWHAAWERDHPELLGLAGPSFYRPGADPLLGGLTMAEASANVLAATERLKRHFPTKGGHMSSDATIYDLSPFPEWMMEKPEPPQG